MITPFPLKLSLVVGFVCFRIELAKIQCCSDIESVNYNSGHFCGVAQGWNMKLMFQKAVSLPYILLNLLACYLGSSGLVLESGIGGGRPYRSH